MHKYRLDIGRTFVVLLIIHSSSLFGDVAEVQARYFTNEGQGGGELWPPRFSRPVVMGSG